MGGPVGWADDHAPISDDFRASIKSLSNLRGADYGELALAASNILLEKRLPSIDKRLEELKTLLKGDAGLDRSWGTAEAGDLKCLSESPTLAVDLLPSLFTDADAEVADASLEVYTKRVYRAHNVISTNIVRDDGLTSMNFKFQFNTSPRSRRCARRPRALHDAGRGEGFDARDPRPPRRARRRRPADTPVHVLHVALSAQGEVRR